MARFDRDAVLEALRVEDVARHLTIDHNGRVEWRGLWMRSRRCARTDHNSEAFGIKRDGFWHCWSCDEGGDLLSLLAASLGIDIKQGIPRDDFGRVLELAASIAGVAPDDEFSPAPRPAPAPRPQLPPVAPLIERLALAKKRAAWVWSKLVEDDCLYYLRSRGLNAADVARREIVRMSPLRVPQPAADANADLVRLWHSMRTLSMVVPVRSVDDGAFVDLRSRRFEPRPGQPKIIGMLGGVTVDKKLNGERQLIGCYGRPHDLDSDLVIVVEGALDYLTALVVWPNASVLGATDAGSLALVAGHAARVQAARDDKSELLIVEQTDPPRVTNDGRTVPGPADSAINEQPNGAAKVALRLLGPKRVGWLYCQHPDLLDGKPVKDLNDLHRVGADIGGMICWLGEPVGDPG